MGVAVAAFVGLTYDWALTFGQEIELIWRQRWSLMTVLYLGVRYLGMLYVTLDMLDDAPIISLTDTCGISSMGDIVLVTSVTWILSTVWEVLALCLAVWIAVKHFRELRQHPAGGIIGDCFTVLMKTHVVYFVSFIAVSCFHLILQFTPTFLSNDTLVALIISGFLQILEVVQMFVLGPRLILSIREYSARLVVGSDAATAMTSIAFQERVHISTGSSL
ncbi:uncharacterized protein EDB93DRAFT_1253109 [Suillus bovinus]|uniref:uncharacterized protein n=1 Tax=Suillus bovinus TaxID=48563 RepID=UPI001B860079|nr:uncharacterized protein EDB93DRAFT_1253109 [Suillus bovinus]KAG2139181.1 hypothetical protein EDB93DRAFT_1253109 [Suillus bovinus]